MLQTNTTIERVCVDCGKLFKPNLAKIYSSKWCPECSKAAIEKDRQEEQKKKEQWEKERIERGIPHRFLNSSMSDFNNEQIGKWFEKPENFLFITGPCGTGKTHIACALTMALRKSEKHGRRNCMIVFSSDLFLRIRSSFGQRHIYVGDNESEEEIISSVTKPYIYVFDDVGAQKQSEFVIETWYAIIDRRYREAYPTVFTSNMSLKEISIHMSDRIASRLAEGVVVELIGKDRRIKKEPASRQAAAGA